MAGGNSINKTKYKNKAYHHAQALAKKRALKVRNTKLALGRYHDKAVAAPGESTEIALYKGAAVAGDAITTQSLSKKRAKKLARNMKYIRQRLGTPADEMLVDEEPEPVKEGQTERVKKALWNFVENWQPVLPLGAGTTLGA